MTLIGFPFLLWIFKRLFHSKLIYAGRVRYFFIFFGLFTLQMPTTIWAMKLAGVFTPNFQLVSDGLSSYAIISLTNLTLVSIACMFVYFKKRAWFLRAMVGICLFGVLYLGYLYNWYTVAPGWFFGFAGIDIGAMFLAIFIMDRLTAHPPDNLI